MARSVARSLIQNNGMDLRDMARRFTDEFFKEQDRGYGGSVAMVFGQLRDSDCVDPFGPASQQFDGQGSYGNGGAMRISPAALYAQRKSMDFEKLKELATSITRITHSHPQAIQGAVLQCHAVSLALHMENIDVDLYIDSLIDRMKGMERQSVMDKSVKDNDNCNKEGNDEASCDNGTGEGQPSGESNSKYDPDSMPYCLKLEKIRQFVKQEKQPSTAEIGEELGVDIAALDSVPAAIYTFLRCAGNIDGIDPGRNAFERTVIYAISLGGDTDTVATMAASIAGAYYGIDDIPQSWQDGCEGVTDALKFAEDLYSLDT